MVSYFDGLLRYFEFAGRSSRKQYWLFYLFTCLVMVVAFFGDLLLAGWRPGMPSHTPLANFGPLTAFVIVFHIIPNLTITVRRLHDINRSGWWWLLSFVPFGGLVVFVWTLLPGTPYDNDYGSPGAGNSSSGGGGKAAARQSAGYTLPPGRVVRTGAAGERSALSVDSPGTPTQRFI